MFRIAILLSGRHGRGSNMASLAEACASERIPGAAICAVVGSHSDSPAIVRAAGLGLETLIVDPRCADHDSHLADELAQIAPDLICLAGFMRKLPDSVLQRFPARIVNIHPALLPSFGGRGMYGRHVHEAVLARGCKVSGCTVHFVDEEFDTGPIVVQRCVPVLGDDTAESLAARVLEAEHKTYVEAVGLIAQGRVRIAGRRVEIAEHPASPSEG